MGSQLVFDVPQSAIGSSQLVIRDPDGSPQRPVIVETPRGDQRVICDRPDKVGFYRLMMDTTVVAEEVVNLDTRESNTAADGLPEDDPTAASLVQTSGDFLKNLQASRQGR